jgi:hypothetical protein
MGHVRDVYLESTNSGFPDIQDQDRDKYRTAADVDEDISKLHEMRRRICAKRQITSLHAMVLAEITKCEEALMAMREFLCQRNDASM